MKLLSALHLLLLMLGVSSSNGSLFNKKALSPVIFVPGNGGSQMEAKLNKTVSPLLICQKSADWYSIWLNLEQLVPPVIYCWVDNIKLNYNSTTRTTSNTPGVQIHIPGWGDPEVVEWIDPTRNSAGAYFKDIANMLVTHGYERKKNIRGAPYDFRKGPNELQQWFVDFKELIEDTYELNEATPVTLISHSMGSPLTLAFLQQQTVEWKRKYIQRLISLAGVWGGSMKAMKVFAMGDNLDSHFLIPSILKLGLTTAPSSSYLLPSPLFWKSSEVLVETPSRVYTMSQLQTFFEDLGNPIAWEMRKDTMQYSINYSPPDVELHCLYGNGLDTVERLRYSKDSLVDKNPKLIMGRGDGTVNERSLRGCHHWSGYQEAFIDNVELNGVDHMAILSHRDVLSYIESVVLP